jgi:DNA-binding transcriptional ArsR family regulator
MPRAATTADAFNAVAERRRRDIIDVLSLAPKQRYAVGDIVLKLNLAQPAVSKHLGVLRKVGLVTVLRQGQHRYYSLNARQLKPVHDWVKSYERFWDEHLDAIKQAAERKARERAAQKNPQGNKNPHSLN